MAEKVSIDNDIYERLGERWYTANDDPVALLRAESRLRNPWVLETVAKHFSDKRVDILDLGCGAGFLSNSLALHHNVTGYDISEQSLKIAAQYDVTKSVKYLKGDATAISLPDKGFDVVCCMDMLEHVENYTAVIKEASRVLKPGGLFIFYTFNRNPISGFLAIKVVEWLVPNTPKHMHLYRMFIKPKELIASCNNNSLSILKMKGLRPTFQSVVQGLFSKEVPTDFSFCFTSSLMISYLGVAQKT